MKKLLFLIGSVVVFTLFLFVTKNYNLGMTPDSIGYIEVARNFSDGKGIVDNQAELVTHWPPVYPILLGLFSKIIGQDVLEAGVYFNAILFLIYGWLFYLSLRTLNLKNYTSLFFLILLLLSLPTTEYLFYSSEGLFITLNLLILLLFFKWVRDDKKQFIILTGFFSGLMFLTRYAGLGFIAGYALYILFFIPSKSIRKRFEHLFYYLFPVVFLVFIWLVYTHTFNKSSVNRTMLYHPIELEKLKNGIKTVFAWFNVGYLFVTLLVGILLLYLVCNFNTSKLLINGFIKTNRQTLTVLLVLILSYFGFLVFSISFFDAYTPMDTRILSPLFPFILILIGVTYHYFLKKPPYSTVGLLLLILLLIGLVIPCYPTWKNHYFLGTGYTSSVWRNSETIKYLTDHGDLNLYTNGPDVIKLYTSHNSHFLPIKISPVDKQLNPLYEHQLEEFKDDILNGTKQLLYFDHITWRYYLTSKDEILKEFEGLNITYFNDGFLITNKLKRIE